MWATPYGLTGGAQAAEGVPPLGKPFFNDLKRHDLSAVLGKVHHCLVIHGDMDEQVPVKHARFVFENVREPKTLEVVPGGDHRFTHSNHRETAYRLTIGWFKRCLKE